MNKKTLLALLYSLVGCSTASKAPTNIDNIKDKYIASYKKNIDLVINFTSDEDSDRKDTAKEMLESASYVKHISNYLEYYRSLNGEFDIFKNEISNEDILNLEKATRGKYSTLLKKLFGLSKIKGENTIHLFLNPTSHMGKSARLKLTPKKGTTFKDIFKKLKKALPADLPYKVTLILDPDIPGGMYRDTTKSLHMSANIGVNISSIMGLVHEFGHSVFATQKNSSFKTENPKVELIIKGFNEGYAETWSNNLSNLTFTKNIFPNSNQNLINDYKEFRSLYGLRFHLLALLMDREILEHPDKDASWYIETYKEKAREFIFAQNMPPLIPIMPQSQTPGYLPSYLLINIGSSTHLDNSNNLIKSLLDYAKELHKNDTDSKWSSLLHRATKKFLNEH